MDFELKLLSENGTENKLLWIRDGAINNLKDNHSEFIKTNLGHLLLCDLI